MMGLLYFVFGLGFYTSLAIVRRHTFEGATISDIIKGFIACILFWPAACLLLPYIPPGKEISIPVNTFNGDEE